MSRSRSSEAESPDAEDDDSVDRETAPVDPEEQPSELLKRLQRERMLVGRGNLRLHRNLWIFCGQSYREWAGTQLVADAPTISAPRLTRKELMEWLRLADDFPAVARDVLRLRRLAQADNGNALKLWEASWPPEQVDYLIELHALGIAAAQRQKRRAEVAVKEAKRKEKLFANSEKRITQCRKMVSFTDRMLRELTDQWTILRRKKTPAPES